MWVFCGGLPDNPSVLNQYQPTRSGKVALDFFENYRGYIQSDDFSGYDYLGQKRISFTLDAGPMFDANLSMWSRSEKNSVVKPLPMRLWTTLASCTTLKNKPGPMN